MLFLVVHTFSPAEGTNSNGGFVRFVTKISFLIYFSLSCVVVPSVTHARLASCGRTVIPTVRGWIADVPLISERKIFRFQLILSAVVQ